MEHVEGSDKDRVGWAAERGQGALQTLLIRVMASKMEEAGCRPSEEDLREKLNLAMEEPPSRTGTFEMESTSASLKFFQKRTAQGLVALTAEVCQSRRVTVRIVPRQGLVEMVSTVLSGDRARRRGGEWEVHDLPSGGAASTQIQFDKKKDLACVVRETHFSHGEKWNPSPGKHAEVCFYQGGNVRWRQSFVAGLLRAAGDLPVYESFWENGTRQVEEYGSCPGGRHRERNNGPAYMEFYPNGAMALCMFAQKGRRSGPPLFFWADGEKREPSKADLAVARSTLHCSRLTSPSDWIYPAGFFSRHPHCVERGDTAGTAPALTRPSLAALKALTKTAKSQEPDPLSGGR